MKAKSQFGAWLAAGTLLCGLVFAADAAQAQGRRKQGQPSRGQQGAQQRKGPPPQAGKAGNVQPAPQNRPQQFRRGQMEGPPPFLQRLRQMRPQEQERFLKNNPRFRQLPPERQAQIRENLRRWNAMSPQQQQRMIEVEENWMQMPPEQRRHVREVLMPRWEQLEPPRRQAIMRRMGVLKNLSEEERAAKLSDEAFLSGLNDDDRELLRELSKLRLPPPQPHEPPDEPMPEPLLF